MAKLRPIYTVYVDDNFHYQDEGARYTLGDFPTLEEAVTACKNVVDLFLETSDVGQRLSGMRNIRALGRIRSL